MCPKLLRRKTRVKAEDKENLSLARAIKAKREVELVKGEHGLSRKEKKPTENFVAFLERQIRLKKANLDVNDALLKKVKSYLDQKQITLAGIDTDWCNQFKQYLFTQVSSNTTRSYLFALKFFLDVAVRKGYILINPLVDIKFQSSVRLKKRH